MEPIEPAMPIILVGKTFGLMPLSFGKRNPLAFTKLSIVYSGLLLAAYCALLTAESYDRSKKVHAINRTVNNIQMVCFIVTIFAHLLNPMQNYAHAKQALQTICFFDAQIERAGAKINHKSTKVYVYCTTIFAIVVSICMGLLDYYTKVLDNPTMTSLHWLCVFVPIVFNTFNACQISVFAMFLYQRYQKLNEIIRVEFLQLENNKTKTNENGSRRLVSSVGANLDTSFDQLRYLLRLIEEVGANINAYYGIPILVTIGAGFVVLTAQVYYIMTVPLDWKGFTSVANWIMVHILQILLIVTGFHYVNVEADGIVRSLGKVNFNKKHNVINYKVCVMALQMKINPIEFTARNVFKINFELLHSLIATLTTYVIILVQFNDASKQSGNDSGSKVVLAAQPRPDY